VATIERAGRVALEAARQVPWTIAKEMVDSFVIFSAACRTVFGAAMAVVDRCGNALDLVSRFE
jgi:formiminotetrahydrofolate cyclodeaminase